MRAYTVTTETGTFTYEAGTQAEALRAHRQARPGTGVLGVVESATYRAQASGFEAQAED